jgi:SAM-dependent methyltransferase
MQTLIRYMLENNYQQGTEAVEMLCSGEEQEYTDLTYGGTARWGLSLGEGGKAYDLGCGPGRALDVLEQRVGKGNAIGYEMNPRWALHDERIRLGIIDHSQSKLLLGREGARERLSFSERFGTASFVLASLVMDRVANQYELLQNCSKLVRPGGALGIALLLPVSIEDDEPGLGQRLRYVVDPITEGDDVNVDTQLIVGQLETLGFDRVMRKHLPVRDPITNGMYDNHHLIVAQKRGK